METNHKKDNTNKDLKESSSDEDFDEVDILSRLSGVIAVDAVATTKSKAITLCYENGGRVTVDREPLKDCYYLLNNLTGLTTEDHRKKVKKDIKKCIKELEAIQKEEQLDQLLKRDFNRQELEEEELDQLLESDFNKLTDELDKKCTENDKKDLSNQIELFEKRKELITLNNAAANLDKDLPKSDSYFSWISALLVGVVGVLGVLGSITLAKEDLSNNANSRVFNDSEINQSHNTFFNLIDKNDNSVDITDL